MTSLIRAFLLLQPMQFQSNNSITIQGWMITDLHLKGTELLIYAIIYGMTQYGDSDFYGSLTYLESATNKARTSVIRSIEKLESLGLIRKYIWKD